jgi:L-lactate dehydrogenase complex protein LldF
MSGDAAMNGGTGARQAGTGALPHIDMIGNAERAVQDAALQRALHVAMPAFRRQRDAAAADVPDWEELRATAAAIKDHALAHLATYLTRLETQIVACGGVVHWAADAAEARRIITDLAHERGVRRVVKSKSMTTEEIEVNPALETAGVEVVETDLGEFIIQLAGEHPSHIVVPALHWSTAAVAELFAAKLGIRSSDRPEDLARVAREMLRARFLAADMGISGVNFAVAETGTIAIVENEGNARLTTTRPRIHVAVMGLEKVVPRLADLGVMLRLLAPSATGQRASVYVSLLTGPRRPGEADGPEELHLVVLDNGRTRVLADPGMRESLRCIRCGACINVCPVFERAGGHAYGSVYQGPIGAVITPAVEGLERAGELPFASTLCGACAEVCPVKIDLPRMLLELRGRAVQAGQIGRLDRLFARGWTFVMGSPGRLRILGAVGRLLQRVVVRRGRIERLPFPLSGWTVHRSAPPLAATSFRDRWAARRKGPR